jgi:hypothetical protein
MSFEKIDPRLKEYFSKTTVPTNTKPMSRTVAALIDDEYSKDILSGLESFGPANYLTNLGILLCDVEKNGFDYLVQERNVFALSDGELICEIPQPTEGKGSISNSSRELMRGESSIFSEYEGKGVVVGVLDTGVFSQHETFGNRVLEQVNCVYDNLDGDVNGHGTHVAGSIVGESIGVASEAEILDLRVFGRSPGASVSSILMGLDQAIGREVDVVNMSLGSNYPSYVMEDAVDQVVNNGIFVCAAAGNSGPSIGTINSPSSARLGLSVSSTDAQYRVSSFSSRGPCRWHSWQKPNCAGFGENVLSASHHGGYCVMSGTSMATPGVAGVIAVLIEQQRENDDKFGTIDWLMRHGGEQHGQHSNDVGSGFVSLHNLEQYVDGTSGLQTLQKKKRSKHIPRGFFKELLKCEICKKPKILHRISHRSDDTIRLQLSCMKDRIRNKKGNIIFDDMVLERWQYSHITDKQYIKAMRRCGICSKEGVVVTDEWKVIPYEQNELPHSTCTIGCLFCKAKGKRVVPSRIANLWSM